jgi:hypothetical protein
VLNLPPPSSFAEGQRQAFGIAAAVAGVCFGLAAVAAICVVIWGNWPNELARTRLLIVGIAALLASAGSIIVTVGLLVGGPVGRVKTVVSKESLTVEAEEHAAAK